MSAAAGGDSRRGVRALLVGGLAVLVVAHQDVPLWDEARLVFGIVPPSLLYHVVYCVVAAAWLTLLVRHAWPSGLDDDAADPDRR